jgi:hypothetical protein
MKFVVLELFYKRGMEEPEERTLPGTFSTEEEAEEAVEKAAIAIGPAAINGAGQRWLAVSQDGTVHMFFVKTVN